MQSRYSMNKKDKKPYIKWILIIGAVLIAASITVWLYLHDWDMERSLNALTGGDSQQPAVESEAEEQIVDVQEEDVVIPEEKEEEVEEELPVTPEPNEEAVEEEVKDATVYPESIELPDEPTVIDGILLANKQNPLPSDYAPGVNPDAQDAFGAMRAEALKSNIDLTAFSTFRDFARQKELYEGYVAKDGQEKADRYSARPGFSEHQTGLAFDIGESGAEQHWAAASFGDTEAGKWVADNAHRFGFILRYPEGKEQLTGYMHESWHFRYVGKEAAKEIYDADITLEEYLEQQ
ncbi:M15 family metallopeptidase [Planomicrobium okeanokoites]|uniref:D-alanyl-D-alanine carboxypeptidase family protein n=1 Tax=Planomicrobium okeanokoites TaxID=244 RepID=A0ABV7KGX5_PLAOK|nr:M15 family metallopeptidase [Planomicrobium okeanokoites]TAA68767.1 D-alanyl-D-alanine carboxypeptidase family protein [Planomicrobium okeanokoites]